MGLLSGLQLMNLYQIINLLALQSHWYCSLWNKMPKCNIESLLYVTCFTQLSTRGLLNWFAVMREHLPPVCKFSRYRYKKTSQINSKRLVTQGSDRHQSISHKHHYEVVTFWCAKWFYSSVFPRYRYHAWFFQVEDLVPMEGRDMFRSLTHIYGS